VTNPSRDSRLAIIEKSEPTQEGKKRQEATTKNITITGFSFFPSFKGK
jgi:hypothetical protein